MLGRMKLEPKHKSTKVSADDARLFREAIGAIRPLAEAPTPERQAPPAPHPAMFERDEAAVRYELLNSPTDPAALEVGDELLYLRDGHSPLLLKRLRRGTSACKTKSICIRWTRKPHMRCSTIFSLRANAAGWRVCASCMAKDSAPARPARY